MRIEPEEFMKVPVNAKEEHACSPPEPETGWRGIVIRGPTRVTFRPGERFGRRLNFAVVPICGLYMLPVPREPWRRPMRLVARDRVTGQIYTGDVVRLNAAPLEPLPAEYDQPLTAEEVEGLASGEYFNPNLTDFVALPPGTATYEIHVEHMDHRSNVVTVEIIEAMEAMEPHR